MWNDALMNELNLIKKIVGRKTGTIEIRQTFSEKNQHRAVLAAANPIPTVDSG